MDIYILFVAERASSALKRQPFIREVDDWSLSHGTGNSKSFVFFPWFLEMQHDQFLFISFLFTLHIHLLLRVHVKQFLQSKVLRYTTHKPRIKSK
jgi:hypothetical protein